MDKELVKRLKQKGWSDRDINKAFKIMNRPEAEAKPFMNKVVYWSALVVTIIGNLFLSVVIILFLISLSTYLLYFIIAAIALSFGMLFNLIINDIENIDREHHIIASIFIPAIALINIVIITVLANQMIAVLQLQNSHNPIVVSVVYTAAFMAPYMASRMKKQR